jgi:hypothetical protein
MVDKIKYGCFWIIVCAILYGSWVALGDGKTSGFGGVRGTSYREAEAAYQRLSDQGISAERIYELGK